jgi:hypothetical protein
MVRLLAPLVALLWLVPEAPAQGLLQRARVEMAGRPRAPAPAPPAPPPKRDEPTYSPPPDPFDETQPEDTLALLALGAAAAVAAVTSPVWVPFAVLDNLENDACFPDHPYACAAGGYMALARKLPEGDPVRRWAVRVGIDDLNDFDSLNRLGVRAWLDTSSRFGAYTGWDRFTERLPGGTDDAVLGSLMGTLCFVQNSAVQMHLGLGGQGWFDAYRPRGGVVGLYSADVFPVKPLVLSAQAEAGNLNRAFTLRLRGSVGMQLRRGEVFVGYDWLRVGGADLHGPLAGLRLWF